MVSATSAYSDRSLFVEADIASDQEAYELTGNQYSVYGVQYKPGFDGAVSSSFSVHHDLY